MVWGILKTKEGCIHWRDTSEGVLLFAQQYWHDPTKPYSFVPVAEFAEHFKSFSVGRKIAEDLAKPPPDTPLRSTKHGEPEV